MSAPPSDRVERGELQALLLTGLPNQPCARFRILRVTDAVLARAWLAEEAPRIAYGDLARETIEGAPTIRQLALTADGLAALGLPADALVRLDEAFLDGMAAPARARRLGDGAPEDWAWGAGETAPHLLQLLYAKDPDTLAALVATAEAETAGTLEDVIPPKRAVLLQAGTTEHFGFSDGISQPSYAGIQQSSADAPRAQLAPGELVLGYADGVGQRARAVPAGDDAAGFDLARNGSYLVCRQLAQDVPGFAAMLDTLAASPLEGAPAGGVPERREWIASRLIGRWRKGCPVSLSAETDDPQHCAADVFDFVADDTGFDPCPRGAHIRRAYPRGSVFRPAPPVSAKERVAARAAADRRRLLRRGRAYGPRYDPADPAKAEAERGLMFVALCADIERQFEFVQGSWLGNAHFAGLAGETDPLLFGDSPFTLPGRVVDRRIGGLAGHVALRGGAYFLLPSRAALAWLGRMRAADAR